MQYNQKITQSNYFFSSTTNNLVFLLKLIWKTLKTGYNGQWLMVNYPENSYLLPILILMICFSQIGIGKDLNIRDTKKARRAQKK